MCSESRTTCAGYRFPSGPLIPLLSDEDSRKSGRSPNYRAFERTFADHLRTLTEQGQLSEAEKATFFWSAVVSDHFAAALSGSAPSFTADDIEVFAPYLAIDTASIITLINEAK